MTVRAILAGLVAAALCLGAALVLTDPGRHWLKGIKAEMEVRRMAAALQGVRRRAGVTVAMPDGVGLATDLYLPKAAGPVPTILVRTPYGRSRDWEARRWVRLFAPRGYAVVVQDMRGRWGSGGVFAPWPNAASDGAATLDWIVAQGWSDGQVGTIGCSALGESQWPLAARAHPAHRAMVALGSGGAAGEIDDLWNFFGMWEGGITTLAPAFGWFTQAGGKTAAHMAPVAIDHGEGLRTLPLRDLVRRFRPDPTDFETLLDGFGTPGWGRAQGYLDGSETIGPAVLVGETWFDHSVLGSLALWALAARSAPEAQLRVGPGTHCDFTGPFRTGAVGDLPVARRPDHDPDAVFLAFMERHLRGGGGRQGPPVTVYALGADRWESYGTWPPAAAASHSVGLGRAALGGDLPARYEIPFDPADPVPSLGGALCCTGNPEDRTGPLDQRPIESRADLLSLTSPALAEPLDLAGPLVAHLTLGSDRADADVIVRLTEVFPDGRSILIQEGALRLRFRHGFDRPSAMGSEPEQVTVRLRDSRRRIPKGHRLRLHVAGSSFPRLARPIGAMLPPADAAVLTGGRLVLDVGAGSGSRLDLTSLAPPIFAP